MSSSRLTAIRFDESERRSGRALPQNVAAAVRAVQETGAVYLENVFDTAFIAQLRDDYVARHGRYFKEDLYDDVLHVGNRRMMISIEVSGLFNQPLLYANPLLFPVLQELLGPRFIMGGFGSVISLPGARAQHIHRDHPELFGDFDYQHRVPCFALTMAIPMIDMNMQTGTTRLVPGSHRAPVERAKTMAWLDPLAPVGSVLIWDYMLYHGGTANTSDRVRPLLYFTYCRPWFRDSANYSTQDPVRVPEQEFARIPDQLKPMFQWTMPRTRHDWSKTPPNMPCPCVSGRLFKDCHGRRVTE